MPSAATHAELLLGLTVQNLLISFDSATPGAVMTIGSITGLSIGDTLVGIDRRPSLGVNNGALYAVGVNLSNGSARIYTINESTAAATLVSTLTADPTDTTAPFPFTSVQGSSPDSFGMDFNPVPDRLRLVSNSGQNLRINVDNGLTQLDVPLAYQAGDPNFGDSADVTAVAYSNNFGGALSTVLRGVDIGESPDLLVTHTNPNGGTLQSTLDLPFDGSLVNYDISGLSGAVYFSVAAAGGPSFLFMGGPGGVTFVGQIGGGVALRGLAAPVGLQQVPELGPGAWGLVALALTAVAGRRRWRARS
ncbi:MAG TPA: DUF4394 domain-containing protein [Chthoniobacterales bacterium]|nr:DUF4394 domain-containing protein [Chthoniobacterales bacterium]